MPRRGQSLVETAICLPFLILLLTAAAEFGLTPRELEVLTLLSGGRTNKEISSDLGISVKTTENHIARIFAKIGVGNRTEAAGVAKQRGLVALDEVATSSVRPRL